MRLYRYIDARDRGRHLQDPPRDRGRDEHRRRAPRVEGDRRGGAGRPPVRGMEIRSTTEQRFGENRRREIARGISHHQGDNINFM